jgi:hypothetical protein
METLRLGIANYPSALLSDHSTYGAPYINASPLHTSKFGVDETDNTDMSMMLQEILCAT